MKVQSALLAAVLCPILLSSGCTQTSTRAPKIGVGDPAVFTTLHIAAANEAYLADYKALYPDASSSPIGLSTLPMLQRHFELTPEDYKEKKTRIDELLDENQRSSAVAQLLSTGLRLSLSYKPAGALTPPDATNQGGATDSKGAAEGSGNGNTKTQPPAPRPVDETTLEKIVALAAGATDSPFDRLDRVNDFFVAYTTLILSSYGQDSRVLDPDLLIEKQLSPYRRQLASLRISRSQLVLLSDEIIARLQERAAQISEVHKRQLAQLELAQAQLKQAELERERASTVSTADSIFGLRLNTMLNDLSVANQTVRDAQQRVDEATRLLDDAATVLLNEASTVDQMIAHASRSVALSAELDPEIAGLRPYIRESGTERKSAQRLVMMLFPVSIDANGVRPNTSVSIRLQVIKPESSDANAAYADPPQVKVVSLHPRRSYDLESQRSVEAFNEILSAAVTAGFSQAAGSAVADRSKRQAEALQLLNRVAKTASWHDAPSRTFGWTFAPSNVQVTPRPVASQVGDFFVGQPGRAYQATASLESGTRLCSAILVLPTDPTTIWFEVSSFAVTLDGTELPTVSHGMFEVSLPPYDGREDIALFVGSVPPAKQATEAKANNSPSEGQTGMGSGR
jgi:hypothetical protein